MQTLENQRKGLNLVNKLVLIGLIGVVVTTAWFVISHNNKPAKKLNAALTSSNSGVSTTKTPLLVSSSSNRNVEQIPELGIQITLPDSIKDLTYQVSTVTLKNGQSATLAMFSTTSLAQLDANCSPSAGPLGSLEKVSGQYPTNDQYVALDYGQLVKQFATFYIAAGSPQAVCATTSAPTQATAASHKSDFSTAQTTIQQSS